MEATSPAPAILIELAADENYVYPIIKLTVLALGIVSLIGASKLSAEENKTAIAADRISLFSVPLRCEAAPDIGCGPISKPILLQLEREPVIAEAWLNATGTVLAVVLAENHR